jgi:tetratricopeptide (TPR) repeat protein
MAVLAAQAPDPSAEGLRALEANRYEEAVAYFTKAVEANAQDYAAQFHLALALSLLGRDAEAIARYKTVLELKPGLYEAELNLGIVLLRQKRPQEAVPHLEAAVRQKPEEFRPTYYLAEAYFAQGDYARAEEYYGRAAAADTKSAAARAGLGRARARLDRVAEAAADLRRAAEMDPAYKDVLLELAALLEARGQKEQAAELYGQFPDNPGARERLGELLIETGKPAEAIPHLEWAVAHAPTPANRLALATAYVQTKRLDKALPLMEQAVAEAPDHIGLRLMYGRLLRDARQYAAAAREFHRVTQAQPNSVEAWNELAGMLILLENYPQALAALDRLKSLGAEAPAHYYFRGMIYDKMRQADSAIENYEKFLELSRGANAETEFIARQRVRILRKEQNRR